MNIANQALIDAVKKVDRDKLERMFIGCFVCLAFNPDSWHQAVIQRNKSDFGEQILEFDTWQKQLDKEIEALELRSN